MNELTTILTPTELEKIDVTEVTENVGKIFREIKTTIRESKGNDKIIRILLYDDYLVLLQSRDNSTPKGYLFRTKPYGYTIEERLNMICKMTTAQLDTF